MVHKIIKMPSIDFVGFQVAWGPYSFASVAGFQSCGAGAGFFERCRSQILKAAPAPAPAKKGFRSVFEKYFKLSQPQTKLKLSVKNQFTACFELETEPVSESGARADRKWTGSATHC